MHWLTTTTGETGDLWSDEGPAPRQVSAVLERLGIVAAAQMRIAVKDLKDEDGALDLAAALAAGAGFGVEGQLYLAPMSEELQFFEIAFDGGSWRAWRVSLDTFSTQALSAFHAERALPSRVRSKPAAKGKKKTSKKQASPDTGLVVIRKLTAAQHDREYPPSRGWPAAGVFPPETASHQIDQQRFLGVEKGSCRVWICAAGKAHALELCAAALPATAVRGDSWLVVRQADHALVRVDSATHAISVLDPTPVHVVTHGPGDLLVTQSKDSLLRLLKPSASGDYECIGSLPFVDQPATQSFPQHRLGNVLDGRVGLCLAYDRARLYAVTDGALVYLTEEIAGITSLHARDDILSASGPGGRSWVFTNLEAAYAGAFAQSASLALPV